MKFLKPPYDEAQEIARQKEISNFPKPIKPPTYLLNSALDIWDLNTNEELFDSVMPVAEKLAAIKFDRWEFTQKNGVFVLTEGGGYTRWYGDWNVTGTKPIRIYDRDLARRVDIGTWLSNLRKEVESGRLGKVWAWISLRRVLLEVLEMYSSESSTQYFLMIKQPSAIRNTSGWLTYPQRGSFEVEAIIEEANQIIKSKKTASPQILFDHVFRDLASQYGLEMQDFYVSVNDATYQIFKREGEVIKVREINRDGEVRDITDPEEIEILVLENERIPPIFVLYHFNPSLRKQLDEWSGKVEKEVDGMLNEDPETNVIDAMEKAYKRVAAEAGSMGVSAALRIEVEADIEAALDRLTSDGDVSQLEEILANPRNDEFARNIFRELRKRVFAPIKAGEQDLAQPITDALRTKLLPRIIENPQLTLGERFESLFLRLLPHLGKLDEINPVIQA